MKKIFLLFASICFTSALFSQTLFTYGDGKVEREEFLRAYNKNKTPVTDKEKALRDYLDLYIKFKLKVKAARDMHLDTLQQLQTDLQNFRSQVDETYMNNEKAVADLVNEAFLRSQKDIHVAHLFIEINGAASAADSVNMYKGMAELQSKLNHGNANYDELAQEVGKKYGVIIKSSDIGFITVFSIPYEYENIIYNLKPGLAANPYRSRKGLHVFMDIEERASAGKWKIAQILLAFPPGDPLTFRKILDQKADSLYNELQHGADFAAMASAVSDDKLTYMTGGELPEFGSGKFEPAFEKEIFKSNREGFITKPFASAYGLHIVKVIKQIPTPADKKDAAFMYDLKQKVLQDNRISKAKEKFVKEILSQVGYKRISGVKDVELFRYADSVSSKPWNEKLQKFPISDKVIFSFSKDNIKGSDWLNFVHDFKNNAELYKGESNAALLDKFAAASAQDYYKKHLEEYNIEFRHQMDEFKDGNVLFEIMERNVWGNAASDSTGLLKHYNENKSGYKWGPSAGVVIFNCNNKNTALEAVEALKKGKSWQQVLADGNNNIQADSGRYEVSQLPLPAGTKAVEGLITDPLVNTPDGATGFIYIMKLYEGNQQRTFAEARGLVINDYQNVLEEKWIDDLKKKYPVKINESVFQSMLK